jgi:hypothetical protein
MTTKRFKPPTTLEHLPYPKKRCPACDYAVDSHAYYGSGDSFLVCIDERVIDGHTNPMCGCGVDEGYGCIRWWSS